MNKYLGGVRGTVRSGFLDPPATPHVLERRDQEVVPVFVVSGHRTGRTGSASSETRRHFDVATPLTSLHVVRLSEASSAVSVTRARLRSPCRGEGSCIHGPARDTGASPDNQRV